MCIDLYADEEISDSAFAGLDVAAMKLEMLMARNTIFGVARAKPNRLKPPGKFLQAQKLDMGHVKKIKSSIQGTATVPEHGIGICINTKLHSMWKRGEQVTLEMLLEAGIEMHAGNHTRVSIISLNSSFPENPIFWFQQFVCHLLPASEEVFEAIRTAGALSNVKARNAKGAKWFNTTFTMHTNLTDLKARHAPNAPPASALKRLKNSWCKGHGLGQGTMSSYYLLANLEGAFWDKFWTVVSGEGIPESEKKKFKKWTSSNTFNQMSLSDEMIPHDLLQDWLGEGMMGEISAADFRKKCLMHKCQVRLKKKIIDHFNHCYIQARANDEEKVPITGEVKHFESDWKYLADKFPRVTSAAFQDTYIKMRWDQAVKLGFPETLFDDCSEAFKRGSVQDQDDQIEVCNFTHSSFDHRLTYLVLPCLLTEGPRNS